MKTLDMEVTIPQTEQASMAVSNIDAGSTLDCDVDEARSSPGLTPSCMITYNEAGLAAQDEMDSLTASVTVQVGSFGVAQNKTPSPERRNQKP